MHSVSCGVQDALCPLCQWAEYERLQRHPALADRPPRAEPDPRAAVPVAGNVPGATEAQAGRLSASRRSFPLARPRGRSDGRPKA